MTNIANYLSKKLNFDANYFLKSGTWLIIAQISTLLASLLVNVYLARQLDEHDYGIYKYIVELAALLSVFSLTGISKSIIQATALGYTSFYKETLSLTLKYSSLITFTTLIGSAYYYINGNTILSIGCLLIAVFFPFAQLFLNTQSFLYGQGKFKTGSNIQTYRSIFISGSIALTLLFTTNVLILLSVYFITQATSSLLINYVYRVRGSFDLPTPKDIYEKYYKYAFNNSYRNLIVGVANKIDSILVFQFIGAVELALYSIAAMAPDQIKGAIKNIQTLISPKFAKHESLQTIKKNVLRRSLQLSSILILVTACIYILIPPVYTALFPKYTEAIFYCQLLILAIPSSVQIIPIEALQSQHKDKELYIFYITTSLFQIFLIFTSLIVWGLIGVVLARITSQYLKTMVAYSILSKSN